MLSEEDFDLYLQALVEEDQFSGTVLVAQGDQPLLSKACSWADKERKLPNRLDTGYNLASLGKMFTAVAIARLVEQGKLSFHDPIGMYLPDFSPEIASTVTLHHLLTHTSGMGDFMRNVHYPAVYDSMNSAIDLLPLIQQMPLQSAPGQEYIYSNSGYAVLGAVIEQVSGQNYYEYIRQHIFQAAGMMHSDFYTEQRQLSNLARPYTNNEGARPMMGTSLWHPRKGSAAGGCYSTAEDLLRFSHALQSHKLLSASTIEQMTTGKVQLSADVRYAYGSMESILNGVRWVGHSGGSPGVATQFDLCIAERVTVIVLSNQDMDQTFADVVERARQFGCERQSSAGKS